MTAGDGARVSVQVAVDLETAFQVFTEEIDAWWRTGPRFRIAGRRPGRMGFEARPGGVLYETFELPSGPKVFEVGRVLVFEPPHRLELEWRNVNFKPDEKTFVEVTFAPLGDGTLVTVHHRGFAALRPGHPARHGLEGAAFSRSMGMWWKDLMTALREHVAGPSRAE